MAADHVMLTGGVIPQLPVEIWRIIYENLLNSADKSTDAANFEGTCKQFHRIVLDETHKLINEYDFRSDCKTIATAGKCQFEVKSSDVEEILKRCNPTKIKRIAFHEDMGSDGRLKAVEDFVTQNLQELIPLELSFPNRWSLCISQSDANATIRIVNWNEYMHDRFPCLRWLLCLVQPVARQIGVGRLVVENNDSLYKMIHLYSLEIAIVMLHPKSFELHHCDLDSNLRNHTFTSVEQIRLVDSCGPVFKFRVFGWFGTGDEDGDLLRFPNVRRVEVSINDGYEWFHFAHYIQGLIRLHRAASRAQHLLKVEVCGKTKKTMRVLEFNSVADVQEAKLQYLAVCHEYITKEVVQADGHLSVMETVGLFSFQIKVSLCNAFVDSNISFSHCCSPDNQG